MIPCSLSKSLSLPMRVSRIEVANFRRSNRSIAFVSITKTPNNYAIILPTVKYSMLSRTSGIRSIYMPLFQALHAVLPIHWTLDSGTKSLRRLWQKGCAVPWNLPAIYVFVSSLECSNYNVYMIKNAYESFQSSLPLVQSPQSV